MGRRIKLTGDYRDYPVEVIADAEFVVTSGDKVCKDRDGHTPRQATRAEIESCELVAPC